MIMMNTNRSKLEHIECLNRSKSIMPQIQLLDLKQGETMSFTLNTSKIIFLLEGEAHYSCDNKHVINIDRGNMQFLPTCHYTCNYFIEQDAKMLILHLENVHKLCDTFFVEHLFDPSAESVPITTSKTLRINDRLLHFTQELQGCINDGMQCSYYFNMKVEELFILLRVYYTKSELRSFFSPLLSGDVTFSEYVKTNRHNYTTVVAFAKSMGLTQKQFAKRFREVFQSTPYKWMKEGKAMVVRREIATTKKTFRQIAEENGFSTLSQFTKFCKKEIGKNPGEIRKTESYRYEMGAK